MKDKATKILEILEKHEHLYNLISSKLDDTDKKLLNKLLDYEKELTIIESEI
jgi:hypothetical protein